jgi:hypothetical protein
MLQQERSQNPLVPIVSPGIIKAAVQRYESAKTIWSCEDAALDVLLEVDPPDPAIVAEAERSRVDPAAAALVSSHRELCELLKSGGYSAVLLDGQVFVRTPCDDATRCDDCHPIEFAASRLLNLDGGVL